MNKKHIFFTIFFITILLSSCSKRDYLQGKYSFSAKYKTELLANPDDTLSVYGYLYFEQKSTINFIDNTTFEQTIFQKCVDIEIENENLVPQNTRELLFQQIDSEKSFIYNGTYFANKGIMRLQPNTITFVIADEMIVQNYAEYLNQNNQDFGPSTYAQYLVTEDSLIFNPNTPSEEIYEKI